MPRPFRSLTIRAPAKINLFLKILGKRRDGYHELLSLFLMVGLYDEIAFEPDPRDLRLFVSDPALTTGDENLVIRAARLLAQRTGLEPKARIRLQKNIPMGAGLGGGSSDAAAALVGLNRLWRTGLSRSDLSHLGLQLGSDVPFFLKGPSALVGGRGERILPVVLPGIRPLAPGAGRPIG